MFVLCIANRAGALADHQRGRGESESVTYPVTPGRLYPVIAMLLWQDRSRFLIRGDWGLFVNQGVGRG